MADLVWVPDCKPDRPGIWAKKVGAGYIVLAIVPEQQVLETGTWAFICDLPTIAEPPKWREVTAADVGEEITVRSMGLYFFIGFNSNGEVVYENSVGHACVCNRRDARILDDGQPKREAREVWVPCYSHGRSCLAYDTYEEARKAQGEDWTPVRFREVIE